MPKNKQDPDFEKWLEESKSPEASPREVEAEEDWLRRVSEQLRKNLNKEKQTCQPKSRA
jgi:hypothetical protein